MRNVEIPASALTGRRSASELHDHSVATSGRRNSDPRPPRPERDALPSCATTGWLAKKGSNLQPPGSGPGALPIALLAKVSGLVHGSCVERSLAPCLPTLLLFAAGRHRLTGLEGSGGRRSPVGMAGFEPATPWSQTRCATKLRHIPSSTRGPSCVDRHLAIDRAPGGHRTPDLPGKNRLLCQLSYKRMVPLSALSGRCVRRGSNPHPLRDRFLRPARMPSSATNA